MPDIKTLLTSNPISVVLAKRPLVYLGHTATVGTLLEVLSSHGILSAPIFTANAAGVVESVSLGGLLGFADLWAVLVAFLQSLPASPTAPLTAEQLEAHGAELCQRPVVSLFDNMPNIRAALETGTEPHITCADWEMSDDPNTSLLDVIRTCFLPRMPPPTAGGGLVSYGSGMGFMAHTAPSPRVSGGAAGGAASQPGAPASPMAAPGHARHPAASHRIVVSLPGGELSVLSQSDILRFLAAHHDALRPLGKASLTELGLASGSLHLAAGPPTATCARPPPLSPVVGPHPSPFTANNSSSSAGGGGAGGGGSWGAAPGTPGGSGHHNHQGQAPGGVPSSPKPPLGRSSLDLGPSAGGGGGGGGGGSGGILGTSPNVLSCSPGGGLGGGGGGSYGSEPGHYMAAAGLGGGAGGAGGSLLQRGGSGGGPAPMQTSPPASPRVSGGAAAAATAHLLGRGSSLGGGHGHGHRSLVRRQLVAVHESVPVLEAFKVLLQQRVSAVAVLAGSGPSPNMRLVGNLSASDLRHLRAGGFGGLALTVKAFLAGKPLAPDQAIRVSPPPPASSGTGAQPHASAPPPAASAAAAAAAAAAPKAASTIIMAHAPTCFTCQATASLDELIRMLGGRCAGIHRVYVVDPDQRPAGVVTTTDVLQLLSCACSKE